MKRTAMLRWLGTGALGLSLVAGCSHSRSGTVRSGTSTPVACASCGCAKGQCPGTAVAGTPIARTVPMYTSAATVPAPSYGTIPTPKLVNPVMQTAAREAQPAVPTLPEAPLKSPFTRGEPAPARRSFVDITAAACFSHAPDYRTICGQLEHSRATNTWRLRYLSVDESDAHGGSVTLTGDSAQLSVLQDGHYVKVQGHLCNTDHKGIAPAYRVESVEALGNAN